MKPDGHVSISPAIGITFDQQPLPAELAVSLSRTQSEVSLYTPMRRKSLLTPGIATRAPTPAVRIPPKPKPKTRHSLPVTPARRGSLEPMNDAPLALLTTIDDPASIPRALTPSDLDYKQTGAFKLGTLRITNASPVRSPAVDRMGKDERRLQVESEPAGGRPRNDYFEDKVPDSTTKVQSTGLSYVTEDALKKQSNIRSSVTSPVNCDIDSPSAIRLQPTKPQVTRSLSSDSGGLSYLRQQTSPKSPELQVTSKHTAMEDELFEAEPLESPPIEVLDVRVDPSAKSLASHPSMSSKRSNSTGMSRTDSGIGTSPASEKPCKPLVKADSGYSSNVSLRSFSSRRRREKEARRSGEAARPKTPPEWPAKLERSRARAYSENRDGQWAPEVPEKDHIHGSELTSGSCPSRRNLRLLGSFTKKSKTSMSDIRIQDEDKANSQSPTDAPVSTLSIDITAKQKKIQRLLSGARAPFTVRTAHMHSLEQASIPPVPQDAESKLRRRSDSLPKLMRGEMLKTARSKDTLGTIFSVGSAEGVVDGAGPSSQSQLENGGEPPMEDVYERDHIVPMTVALESAGPSLALGSMAARSAVTRKPVPQRVRSFEAGQDMRQDISHALSTQIGPSDQRDQGRPLPSAEYKIRNPIPASDWDVTTSTLVARRKAARNTTSYDSGFPAIPSAPTTAKSPPPVSMQNRSNKGYAQSRPDYTIPAAPVIRSNSQPTTHHENRDAFYSSPASAAMSHSTSSLVTLRRSHESFSGHSYAHQPQSPVYGDPVVDVAPYRPTDPMLSAGLSRPQSREHRVPRWDVQTDHDTSRSRQSSVDRDRSYVIGAGTDARSTPAASANSSRANSFQDRPAHPHPPPQLDPRHPPVRHRSSYDGHARLHPQRSHDWEGDAYLSSSKPVPAPVPMAVTTQAYGQVYAGDPRRARRASHQQLQQQQWAEPARHINSNVVINPAAPYSAPRGHVRNRTMGASVSCDRDGNPLPFRVLHSYNSPAYRNVPIWG